jgi:hypothetical protein
VRAGYRVRGFFSTCVRGLLLKRKAPGLSSCPKVEFFLLWIGLIWAMDAYGTYVRLKFGFSNNIHWSDSFYSKIITIQIPCIVSIIVAAASVPEK